MKKIIEEKSKVVDEIKARLSKAASVVVTDYRGLTVLESTDLRTKLRDAGVDYKVLKNTLIRRAVKEEGIEGIDEILVGPTAVAFSEDAVAPSKVLFEFAKIHKALDIKGGLLEGKAVSMIDLQALSELPSREVLLSQVCGTFAAPMQQMASLFAAPMRDFAGVVNALAEKNQG